MWVQLASYDRAVRTIRETNGVVLSVTDEEILEAKAIIDASGVGAEPASAASVAGARKLVNEGIITLGDHVVCVLTGHMLKDPGAIATYHSGEARGTRANVPVHIDATENGVRQALISS